MTDAGNGYVKGRGNPQGDLTLVSELVAGELCAWFGLDIPPFAIIKECAIELPMQSNGRIMRPPLFFSKAIDGMPADGSDTFLQRISRRGDVAKLVVFDTWVRNVDRCSPGLIRHDNLMFKKASQGRNQYDLVPIDHTHCFVEHEFPVGDPPDEYTFDPQVYGNFPEFAPYIDSRTVGSAIAQLATLNQHFVAQVVNSVPAEWGLGPRASQGLIDLICNRAAFVVDTLAPKLVSDPEIPGIAQ